MYFLRVLVAATVLGSLLGCHSSYIDAAIQNRTERPLNLVEVDYPSASFGTQILMPKSDFHYRFKVLGTGPTKVLWTDGTHKEHSAPGPDLQEKDEGKLTVTFTDGGPVWEKSITNHGQPR